MDQSEALAAYPPDVAASAASVAEAQRSRPDVLVVLDDDPTGTQSVADLPVLTQWDEADFDWAFREDAPAVYVLTNTRSLVEDDAAARNEEVVTNALAAAARAGLTVRFASRSDSTLRGHFPLETDVIAETLEAVTGQRIDGVVVVPAFPEAGRVTVGGVHYMRSGDDLVPIADTEFARDATFGYSSSALAEWVEEKTGGRTPRDKVLVLDLGTIRRSADAIADVITQATHSAPIVADAVTEDDLRLLSLGIIAAEGRGSRLLYRVGPPFVRARIGQEQREPLRADEIFGEESAPARDASAADSATGGLIVVGSHVGLTSRQLERLRAERPSVPTVEIDVEAIVDDDRREAHLLTVVDRVTTALRIGDAIVNTSRVLVRSDDPDESLDISRRVSAAVVAVVQRTLGLVTPRFVIAKGGITSSDVAAFGLGIRHAIIRGPMLPGMVSMWQAVDGPAAGIPYIVFAGNVGDDTSLAVVVDTLSPRPTPDSPTSQSASTSTPTTAPATRESEHHA
jgi:uncharacterized protein YgbK (DUF1537 family)